MRAGFRAADRADGVCAAGPAGPASQFSVCCLASVIWAGATAAGVPVALLASWTASDCRLGCCSRLRWSRYGPVDGPGVGRAYLFGRLAFCLAAIADDAWALISSPDAPAFFTSQLLHPYRVRSRRPADDREFLAQHRSRSGAGISGRCASRSAACSPTSCSCSPTLLSPAGRVDPGLALGRPIVAAFMAPLLALAMARNREWRVDIHVSRQVVLHTATLVASGCFLLAVAVVAMLLRGFGGDWGLVLQLAMLFGSIVVLATVLSSGSVRRRLKFLISRNFFTHRYDYRVEWLKFIELVSEPKIRRGAFGQDHSRLGRVRRQPGRGAVVVEPRHRLLSRRRPGSSQFRGDGKMAIDDPFVLGFRDGSWIQERTAGNGEETWPFASDRAWLAVPLSHRREVVGFVVLDRATHTVKPDWEAFDLLRAAGRQAASYLAEERSTKVLRDSELLTEYSKRFAFVVHDIKNLASQLNLIVSNAKQAYRRSRISARYAADGRGFGRANEQASQPTQGRCGAARRLACSTRARRRRGRRRVRRCSGGRRDPRTRPSHAPSRSTRSASDLR